MSQPEYIKGLPTKEYFRRWRQKNKGYIATKYGRDYAVQAKKKHIAKYPESVRLEKAKRRAKSKGVLVIEAIDVNKIKNWRSKVCGVCQNIVLDKYEFDHIIPITKGGPHVSSNLQVTHPECNKSKGNK